MKATVQLGFAVVCGSLKAATWMVDPAADPASEEVFQTLVDAVASDKILAGDTLILAPGEYVHNGELVIDRELTIRGDGTGDVVLKRKGSPPKLSTSNSAWYDPDRYRYSIRVTADGVTLEHMTLAGWEKKRSGYGWGLGVAGSGLVLNNLDFPGSYIRSAVVVCSEVRGLSIHNCSFTGSYYEAALRGGTLDLLIEYCVFKERHWYGGPILIDDRYPVSGRIRYNYFLHGTGNEDEDGDFNQAGLGLESIGIRTSALDDELLVQHNTFAWESAGHKNNDGNRARAAAILVKEFPELDTSKIIVRDNIFSGYRTLVTGKVSDKAPGLDEPGKHGRAWSFDGEDDFATFLHPGLYFGSKGTLSMWINLRNLEKRNMLLVGPLGEGLAQKNMRKGGDKAFEFQISKGGSIFFYPNYSDNTDGGSALVMSTEGIDKIDQWQHLAFTWDLSAGEGHILLEGKDLPYNSKYNFDLSGKWHNAAVTSSALFHIGRDPMSQPDNRSLQGFLDEFAIFNEVLTLEELEKIREDTVAAHLESLGSKVAAYWPMDEDEDAGLDITDHTGRVTLRLGRGWQGSALMVPPEVTVSHNLFHMNDVDSLHEIDSSNVSGDPFFIMGAGKAADRYALGENSSAARAASDSISNIGASQSGVEQSITFNTSGDNFDGRVYGDTTLLEGSSSSGLPITYEVVSGSGSIEDASLTATSVGSILVRASQGGNANFLPAPPVTSSFSVGKAPLTVRPKDIVRKANQPNPEFHITYTGFFPGESVADIDILPTPISEALADSPIGDYPITLSGGSDDHYELVLQQGTLSIQGNLPLEEWLQKQFGSTSTDLLTQDADKDGFPNLLEYAIGLDPSIPQVLDWLEISHVHGKPELFLTYRVHRLRTDVHLRIQACDELGQVWKNLEFTGPDAKAEILGTTGDIETRRITIEPEHERKFLRLVVEYP